MSAALDLQFPNATLASLTTATPSAADLRVRAIFWRKYLADAPSAADRDCVAANCEAMEALADRMDNPAPVAVLPVSKPKVAARPKAAPKAAKVTAAEFWTLHGRAVAAIAARHGDRWRLTNPWETISVSVPSRLRSYIGPLGGKITWRRDWRMPCASYWPGGVLPDGLDVAPGMSAPSHDDTTGPSLRHGFEARAEQIAANRRAREHAAEDQLWCRPQYPAMSRDTVWPGGKQRH